MLSGSSQAPQSSVSHRPAPTAEAEVDASFHDTLGLFDPLSKSSHGHLEGEVTMPKSAVSCRTEVCYPFDFKHGRY